MTQHHRSLTAVKTFVTASPPAGAVVGDWLDPTGFYEDVCRALTWSRHDVNDVEVAVAGEQYADGRVARFVLLTPGSCDAELTGPDARRLAAALLDAADSLDAIGGAR